jgi:hypothetical protein
MPAPKTPEEKARYEAWQKERFGRGAKAGEPQAPADQVYDGPAPGSPEFDQQRVARAGGVVTDQDRTLAMACHASSLAGCVFPLGNLVVPLVVWLASRKNSTFVDEHGKAAVNFQISVILASILLLLLMFVPVVQIGVGPGLLILWVLQLVKSILVAAAAHRGEEPNYGFGLNLIK